MSLIKTLQLSLLLTFLLVASLLQASQQELMPWASPVNWASLQKYADTITAAKLQQDLQDIYVPDGSWKKWITITPRAAFIEPFPGAKERVELPLALSQTACRPVPRYWKEKKNLSLHSTEAAKGCVAPVLASSSISNTLSCCAPSTPCPLSTSANVKTGSNIISGQPLAGLHIVLDPGHLGGSWSKMEERWFRMGHSKPVEEGTMTFITAKILAKKLRALGATVDMTRNALGPTTPLRPHQLRKAALAEFRAEGRTSWTPRQLKQREEILFYRTAEIHHRADLINQTLRPDLVICMHYDAEEWNNPARPKLVNQERLHFLIGGDFNEKELQTEEDRFMLLWKLLGQAHHEEVGIADAVAHSFVATTALPPFIYHNPTKARQALPSSLYLWNRNLLATRLVQAPVLYCEAYVMNDRHVFNRIQQGDYKGTRMIDGKECHSIYRDYADAVAQGVVNYFGETGKVKESPKN